MPFPRFLTPIRFGYCLALVSVIALASTVRSVAAADSSDGIVAVVNAEPITQKMLADASVTRYGKDVLDNVINRQLIMQACNEKGLQVSEQEVAEEINRIAAKFKLTTPDYLKLLDEERDITPGRYAREIIWPMLALRKLVAGQVEPTQQEFNEAYLAQFGEAVKCRMIMVADKTKADSLHREAVANPAGFGNLAKMNSEDETSASVGGLIPPIRRYTGDSRLEEAAFALKDNEVSPLIQIADQWMFLQAVRRIPAATPPTNEMPAIREQIVDRIRDQKIRGAAGELFAKLQRDANVSKVFGNADLQAKFPGVAAIVNEQRITISALASECVKRHGGDVLEGEINRKLLTQGLKKAGKQVSQPDIDQEIAKAAITYGFIGEDGKPNIAAWMESVTSDGQTTPAIYIQDSVWPSVALRKLVEDEIKITEQDVKQGFESSYGERAEILAIVLSDQRTAQKVWKMARDNPSEEFFGRLAEQYSVEPVSASNRGKVPPIRQHSGQPLIEREAFALKPGELSGIIATADKYIVLKSQGRTTPYVTDLEAVRSELVNELTERKTAAAMASTFDRLKTSAEIDNYFIAAKEIAATAQR
ncbi:peptidylprolyl isomerase [Stieleria varia]|uniref:peptidylprolyl isomerase n=1 Tax=Stieleria varia TaxID=2528005 RepID=A0A5C6AYP9_9BACT|nr:peptidylprolyl isomerase [Stieleria varia]TWU04541.1 Foldase protein PrsA 2 precursor [Stieleria varia]